MKTSNDTLPFWKHWGALDSIVPAPQAVPPVHRAGPLAVACRMFLVLSLLTGMIYPLAVTVTARVCFPHQAAGSILKRDGQPVGSEWLAQRVAGSQYFWPRPSAGDDGTNYATVASAASNLGPTSSNLIAQVRARADEFRAAHHLADDMAVPADMLFASGSGLDPHISPASARLQIPRVAEARKFDAATTERLCKLVEQSIEPRQLGFLGEERVNVLRLNLALDLLK